MVHDYTCLQLARAAHGLDRPKAARAGGPQRPPRGRASHAEAGERKPDSSKPATGYVPKYAALSFVMTTSCPHGTKGGRRASHDRDSAAFDDGSIAMPVISRDRNGREASDEARASGDGVTGSSEAADAPGARPRADLGPRRRPSKRGTVVLGGIADPIAPNIHAMESSRLRPQDGMLGEADSNREAAPCSKSVSLRISRSASLFADAVLREALGAYGGDDRDAPALPSTGARFPSSRFAAYLEDQLALVQDVHTTQTLGSTSQDARGPPVIEPSTHTQASQADGVAPRNEDTTTTKHDLSPAKLSQAKPVTEIETGDMPAEPRDTAPSQPAAAPRVKEHRKRRPATIMTTPTTEVAIASSSPPPPPCSTPPPIRHRPRRRHAPTTRKLTKLNQERRRMTLTEPARQTTTSRGQHLVRRLRGIILGPVFRLCRRDRRRRLQHAHTSTSTRHAVDVEKWRAEVC